MEKLTFEITVHGGDNAFATFMHDGENLTAYCTCAKGELGNYCAHTLGILLGDDSGIVSGNRDQVKTVRGWLHGSDVEAALRELANAELHLESAEARVTRAKEAVAQALRD